MQGGSEAAVTVVIQHGLGAARPRIVMGGALTLDEANNWRDELLALLSSQTSLQLDLSAVADCDSSGVQLLLYAQREAQRRGVVLHWLDLSAPICELLQLLNLDTEVCVIECANES